jgi:hypothetical protein
MGHIQEGSFKVWVHFNVIVGVIKKSSSVFRFDTLALIQY